MPIEKRPFLQLFRCSPRFRTGNSPISSPGARPIKIALWSNGHFCYPKSKRRGAIKFRTNFIFIFIYSNYQLQHECDCSENFHLSLQMMILNMNNANQGQHPASIQICVALKE